MASFFRELRRRNVYKVAAAYIVVAWLLIQAASILLPTFESPGWVMKVFVGVVAAGFPIALVIAWAFELTPEGLKQTEAVAASEGQTGGRAWIFVVLAAGLLSVALFFLGRYTAPPRSADSTAAAKSLAVLPFENLSEDKANAYFADGMQDEIITRLARIGDLKVISRTSTLPYKTKPEKISEVARQLGVGHVVEGTVQRVGDRVRINVQLIDAANDEHLWADLYDRNLVDVFAMQTEVATKIANTLQAKLTGREQKEMSEKPTANMAAYDAYLRGLDFFKRPGDAPENETQAAASFEEAVRLDPQFALGWAALGRANAGMYFLQFDTTQARKEAARTATETATRLAPAAVETLLANAYYRYHVERDYSGARALFERIQREFQSSSEVFDALAKIARRQGRWRESLGLFEQAIQLSPRDPNLFMDRAWTFSSLREFSPADELIERALAIVPDDPGILVNKVLLRQVTGNLPGARAVLDRIPTGLESDDVQSMRVNQSTLERRYEEAVRLLEQKLAASAQMPSTDGSDFQWLGWLRSLAGDKEGGQQAFREGKAQLQSRQQQQPRNTFVAMALALAEAGLGNKEAALREAERAVALLPASEDPMAGPKSEENLAAVEAHVGEVERAIDRLERLLITPYGAFPITLATLRLDPLWDPLRNHPRFKALVEGPEPKTIY